MSHKHSVTDSKSRVKKLEQTNVFKTLLEDMELEIFKSDDLSEEN